MIFIKAKSLIDLKYQLQPMLCKDKVIHKRELGTMSDSIKVFAEITHNLDDITIRIPTRFRDKNVFLFYSDE